MGCKVHNLILTKRVKNAQMADGSDSLVAHLHQLRNEAATLTEERTILSKDLTD